MSQYSVEKLLGRLITDDHFRTEAASSLEKLCRLEGYDLTEGELILVAHLDLHAFAKVAAQLDPGLRRAFLMTDETGNP